MLKRTLLVSAMVAGLAFSGVAEAKSSFTPEQEKEIKKIIRDTIFENPYMIQEAFEMKQQEENVARQEQMKAKIQKYWKDLANKKGDPSAGAKKGDITIVKFFDYQCGFCRRFSETLDELMIEDKDVRVVYKEYPVMGGDMSDRAARAALAANEQGKFKEYHDELLKTSDYSERNLMDIAEKLNLNVKKMKHAISSRSIDDKIKSNMEIAEKLEVSGGIPFAFIEDVFVQGAQPKENLQEIIKTIREERKTKKK